MRYNHPAHYRDQARCKTISNSSNFLRRSDSILEAIFSGEIKKSPKQRLSTHMMSPNDQQVPFIANHIERTTHWQDERLT